MHKNSFYSFSSNKFYLKKQKEIIKWEKNRKVGKSHEIYGDNIIKPYKINRYVWRFYNKKREIRISTNPLNCAADVFAMIFIRNVFAMTPGVSRRWLSSLSLFFFLKNNKTNSHILTTSFQLCLNEKLLACGVFFLR